MIKHFFVFLILCFFLMFVRLAWGKDFDAQVVDIWLDPSDTKAGTTGSVKARYKNLSDPNGPHDGAAQFDVRIIVHKPSGNSNSYYKDNWDFDYSGQEKTSETTYTFNEIGQYKVITEIYDNSGRQSGWDSGRFHSRTEYFSLVNSPPSASRQSPSSKDTTLDQGDSQTFSVKGTDSNGNLHRTEWYLDGKYTDEWDSMSGSSDTADLRETFSSSGIYEIKAIVYDKEGLYDSVIWDVTVKEKKGSFRVQVRHPESGNLVAGNDLNALQLFKDNNLEKEVNPSSGDYTFSNLSPGHGYRIEAYGTNMFIGSVSEHISSGENESKVISAPYQGTLRVRVFHADGINPLQNAHVEIRSHDNRAWRSGDTGSNGWISWAGQIQTHLFPNRFAGEQWTIHTTYDGKPVASSQTVDISEKGKIEENIVTTVQAYGSLQLTVHNQKDVPWQGAECLLFDDRYDPFGEQFRKSTDNSGIASWSNLPPKTYNVEVYYNGISPFPGEEFWASKQVVVDAGETSNWEITRDRPYASGIEVRLNNTEGPTLDNSSTIFTGSTAWVSVVVENQTGFDQTSRVKLIFDRNKVPPFDLDSGESPGQTIHSGQSKEFAFPVQLTEPGIYYCALKIQTVINENWKKTDGWNWAPIFEVISYSTTLDFSGYTWNIKVGERLGPGNNNWSNSPKNVWVDEQGRLHLQVDKIGGKWHCAEVWSQKSFGYGEYKFEIESRLDQFDPNVVAGLFTYYSDENEIDIEFSRWGNSNNSNNGQFVVQPKDFSRYLVDF